MSRLPMRNFEVSAACSARSLGSLLHPVPSHDMACPLLCVKQDRGRRLSARIASDVLDHIVQRR